MKRLALLAVAVTMGLMGLMGTAEADPPSNGRGPRHGCGARAETVVRTGVEDIVHLEVGSDVRQPAPRVFVCYIVPELGNENGPYAGVVSAWADPEYGRVAWSCAKRKDWTGYRCDYNSVELPARGTTPVDHPYGPWGLHLLGLDIGYAYDSSRVGAAVDTPGTCAESTCVGSNGARATARRGLQYRALGWRCTADDEGTCEQADGPAGVTVGEQQAEPTVAVGPLELDVPAACLQASTDVRC